MKKTTEAEDRAYDKAFDEALANEETQTVEHEAPKQENFAPTRALSFDEMMELQVIMDEVDSINTTTICGLVTKVDSLPSSERKDKKGNPVLDEQGQPTFYDPMYWVSIGITGSDDGAVVSAEQLGDIEEGKKYVFTGYRKDRKFRVTKIVSKSDYISGIARQRFGI